MITTGGSINALLGEGDSRRWRLLGGSNGNAGDVVLFGSGLQAYIKAGPKDKRLSGYTSLGGLQRSSGYGGTGCVHVDSWLPGGLRAVDVRVGDRLLLIDGREGVVTYSETKRARLYRLVTAGGVSLVCSESAPIPVRAGGYRTPSDLMGHELRPRVDGMLADWDVIADIQSLGDGDVQHITVEDACFWAGEHPGACLPHHNAKDPDSESGDEGNTATTRDRSGRRGDR